LFSASGIIESLFTTRLSFAQLEKAIAQRIFPQPHRTPEGLLFKSDEIRAFVKQCEDNPEPVRPRPAKPAPVPEGSVTESELARSLGRSRQLLNWHFKAGNLPVPTRFGHKIVWTPTQAEEIREFFSTLATREWHRVTAVTEPMSREQRIEARRLADAHVAAHGECSEECGAASTGVVACVGGYYYPLCQTHLDIFKKLGPKALPVIWEKFTSGDGTA